LHCFLPVVGTIVWFAVITQDNKVMVAQINSGVNCFDVVDCFHLFIRMDKVVLRVAVFADGKRFDPEIGTNFYRLS
tara:strand:+ start:588 stop:815 length:228 start_codon:yes stop_codon:yes gene_type:complete